MFTFYNVYPDYFEIGNHNMKIYYNKHQKEMYVFHYLNLSLQCTIIPAFIMMLHNISEFQIPLTDFLEWYIDQLI